MAYSPYQTTLGNSWLYSGNPWIYNNQSPYTGAPMHDTFRQQGIVPGVPGQRYIEWVEGEVGAKAYQMPAGLEPNKPIPLWDSTDTIIYLKSWNAMGMANPIQKLKYSIEEQETQAIPPVNQTAPHPATAPVQNPEYVTKKDFEDLKEELRMMAKQAQPTYANQNGSKNMNQGGNRA